ncbi:MFS transporter [Pseudonocardia eucalypti]|uniref:MFS transporter n=1 Tax=Pseudonocardia eucalypti TaxID=648755 RepID=A0ABP9RF10_9PSEU|nr:putative MFS transporter [Pseudonocardia eucalypti]
MTQPTQPAEPTRAGERELLARVERLPMSRPHLHLLFQGGLGYTFDGMDAAVIAFILPAVTALFALSGPEQGLLGSSTLIGFFFGALTAGLLGDRIGRRKVMMYALAVYTLASLVTAAAPDWPVLLGSRIVAGFGTGAESAIIAPFLSEFVSSRYRGRFIGSLAGFFSFGYVAAALLGYLLVPAFADGWRVVLVITAVPILMLLWWRRALPESPRYLLSRGRREEAEAVVARLERLTERATGRELPPVRAEDVTAPIPEPVRSGPHGLVRLWRGPLARQTATTWTLWFAITFAYYGFFTFIPSLLVQQGLTISKSFGYSIAIYVAQIPGYYSAAFVSERLDRKWTIGGYLAGAALAAFGLANADTNGQLIGFGMLLSFFMNGTYACLYSYTPEVYPTAIRATGMGAASAFGRIGGICSPIIIGSAYAQLGFSGVFTLTCAVLAVGILAVAVLGVTTKGRTLEDISAQTASVAGRDTG